jgi:Helix-turn-helix domain
MSAEIITREDLEQFRVRLLIDLKKVISESKNDNPKGWLKSSEVRNYLKIGTSKLQSLRITGKLVSSKIGGVHYYKLEDIGRMLNNQAL